MKCHFRSGDPKGGNKMDEIWRTETLVIRYYKKAQEGVLLQTVTSFVKVVPWNLRLLDSGMMTESWIWSWFAFHPEALFMPIIDLSWANEIHVTVQALNYLDSCQLSSTIIQE